MAAVLVAFSCVKDFKDDPGAQGVGGNALTVAQAKAFFDMSQGKLASTRSDGKIYSNFSRRPSPIWGKAVVSSERGLQKVEAPVEAEKHYRAVMNRRTKSGKMVTQRVDVYRKVVVVRSPETGKLSSYTMVIIPDKAYASKHEGDLSREIMSTGSKGDFSGRIVYKLPDSKIPIRASVYKNGKKVAGKYLYDKKYSIEHNFEMIRKVVGSMKIMSVAPKVKVATRGGDDGGGDDGGGDGGGDEEGEELPEEDWDDLGDVGGEGSEGGVDGINEMGTVVVIAERPDPEPEDPETDPEEWVDEDDFCRGCLDNPCSCAGGEEQFCPTCGDALPCGNCEFDEPRPDPIEDPITMARPDIPETMDLQMNEHLCVPAIMEFLSDLFGEHLTYNEISQYYHDIFNTWVAMYGVAITHIEALVDHYFETTTFTTYQNAIDDGNIVMTNVESSMWNSSHNVAVVGYSEEGNLIYMDPMTGRQVETSPGEITGSYNIVIKGNKR